MGLCKCSKRKVTNLFCFEHRVNVCESCLVSSHESCVVQTYLSWLTDSDYDANCILCTEPLSSGETIRLKCFHVFHWSCLNQRASQLPNTTAPAGYKCPSCLDVIFPAINQTSPVIDQLREKLSKVSWAAAGLSTEGYSTKNNFVGRTSPPPLPSPVALEHSNGSAHKPGRNSFSAVTIENQTGDPFEGNTFTARTKLLGNDFPNQKSDARSSTECDDSPGAKYARKASERRSVRFQFCRLRRSVARVVLALVVLLFLYVVIVGRSSMFGGGGGGDPNAEEDPMFDPHANPNIRIESNK